MSKRSREEQEINGVDEVRDDVEDSSSDSETEVKQQTGLSKRQRKQLSAQDIQVLRETAELFKSNIFKLQIDELIKELKIKESHVSLAEKALHKLYELIQQIPDSQLLSLEEADHLLAKSKISIPFPDPKPTKINYKLAFEQPENVALVGSFGLKTGIHVPEGMSIDIALTMPKSLFQPKDYLNFRALYKRAFYLAYICDHLTRSSKKANFPIKISYEYLNGDSLCPILKIESVNTKNDNDLIFSKTKLSINLLVGFPFRIFDSKKLIPDKNCIRIQLDESDELPPTPLYNSSVLSSTAYDYYLKYLYTTKKSAELFRDACVLGKLWLSQRGFDSNFKNGGFGHFEFAILMSALLQGGGVNGNKILLHGFSSYQLFKGTIKYLATQDLSQEGYLSFSSLIGEVNSVYKSSNSNFPTIFDKNTKINILWKMTRSSYEVLKKFANETLVLLNDVVRDRFDPIFLKNLKNEDTTYDIVLKIPISQFNEYQEFSALSKISFITFEHFIKTKVYKILKRALTDRVTLISVKLSDQAQTFNVHKRKPTHNEENVSIIVGLFLNAAECEKLVTKGPDSEDEKAGIEFRQFWGSKASLRRFKDGTIQHCCIWESSSAHPVIIDIVSYICKKQLFDNKSDLTFSSNIETFQKLLPQPLLPSSSKQTVIATQSFQALRTSFDTMVKTISLFQGLPLRIRTVSPTSSALRYSSVLQPVPFAVSNPDFFNDVVLQFETSTNWPDELILLEKTKTAFLLKMDELFKSQTEYKTMLTKDTSIPQLDCAVALNVLTPEGYGFKIKILTERDELLYLRAIENSNEREKNITKDNYLKFNQNYIASIKHNRTIAIMAQHFQFYLPSVRLFKKWLDSQLLLQHFKEELIELICLKVFVDPAPYSVPASVEAAFLRILEFLSVWNWREDLLILDLTKTDEMENDELMNRLSDRLTVQSYQLMTSNFDNLRKQDPSGIKLQFFVASKDDNSGIIWSSGVRLPIASRLTALSKVAISLLQQRGISEEAVKLLFKPALADFDFVLKLQLPFKIDTASGVSPPNAFKNLVGLTGYPDDFKFDPVPKMLDQLNRYFHDVIIFSSAKFTSLNKNGDKNGDNNVITGLFIPDSLTPKKFKVDHGFNFLLTEDGQVVLNKDAVISEIYQLGGDLIKSAEWK